MQADEKEKVNGKEKYTGTERTEKRYASIQKSMSNLRACACLSETFWIMPHMLPSALS
jgi:hypothetical protein